MPNVSSNCVFFIYLILFYMALFEFQTCKKINYYSIIARSSLVVNLKLLITFSQVHVANGFSYVIAIITAAIAFITLFGFCFSTLSRRYFLIVDELIVTLQAFKLLWQCCSNLTFCRPYNISVDRCLLQASRLRLFIFWPKYGAI